MLQEVIRANIETKLNANTIPLVSSPSNSPYFVLGQYYHDDTENKDFIYSIENGYKTIEPNYVPCAMVFNASYKPLHGTLTGSATVNIDFMVSYDDDFNAKLSALEQFVVEVIGNSESIVDGSTTYRTVWNMSSLTPDPKVLRFNGTEFVIITTTVYIEFSDTYHYGNEYGITFDEHEINFISFKNERGIEEDLPHILGETESKGGAKTNARTHTLTCNVDDTMSAILDAWETAFDQDGVHQITFDSPTLATPLDISVVIKAYVYMIEKGEIVSVTITFIISDIAYVEPSYAITYHLDGGANHVDNPAAVNDDIIPITLLSPTKSGYTFGGWYYDSGFTSAVTTISALVAVDVYAKWTIITYTVTYTLNGGTNHVSNPATFTVAQLPITLQHPTFGETVFLGWYAAADFSGAEVTQIATIGNKTLYAKWQGL